MHGHGYDGTDYALADIPLSNQTFVNNSPEDTLIGAYDVIHADSTITLVSPVDGTVKLDGHNLVVGPTPSEAGSFDVVVRDTNDYGSNSPHDTTHTITVT